MIRYCNLGKIILGIICLSGCSSMQPPNGIDQCLRRELFKECLADVPKGPDITHNNAWDGVVSECSSFAQYASVRATFNIKQECRTQ